MSRLDRETGSGLDVTSELTVLTKTLPAAIDDWPLRGAVEVSALTASEGRSLTLRMYADAKLVFESSVPFTSGATAATRTRKLSFKGVQVEAGAAVTLSVESDNANDTTAAVDARLNADVEDKPHTWFVDAACGHDTEHDGRSALTPFATVGAAVTASSAGDTICLSAGTHAQGNAVVEVPDGVAMRGRGIGQTIITSTASLSVLGVTVRPGTGSVIEDLTVHNTDEGAGGQAALGFHRDSDATPNQTPPAWAVVRRCRLLASADGVYMRDASVTPTPSLLILEDCKIESAWDSVTLYDGENQVVLKNCEVTALGPAPAAGEFASALILAGGKNRAVADHCRLRASGGTNQNTCVNASGLLIADADNRAVLIGCDLHTAGTDAQDIRQFNDAVVITAGSWFDTSLVIGTVTHGPPDAAILADTDTLEQRVTAARAAKLDNLDATVSSRSSHDDPDPSGHIDAAISTRAQPADVHVTVTPAYGRQSSRRVGGIIHLPEDSNETLAWHLANSDGEDVDLTGYTGLDLEVYAAAGDLLFERTLANGGLVIDNLEHGRVTITFTPDNLATAGTCKYEFWGTQEGGLPTCLARGSLIIEPTFGPTP